MDDLIVVVNEDTGLNEVKEVEGGMEKDDDEDDSSSFDSHNNHKRRGVASKNGELSPISVSLGSSSVSKPVSLAQSRHHLSRENNKTTV